MQFALTSHSRHSSASGKVLQVSYILLYYYQDIYLKKKTVVLVTILKDYWRSSITKSRTYQGGNELLIPDKSYFGKTGSFIRQGVVCMAYTMVRIQPHLNRMCAQAYLS